MDLRDQLKHLFPDHPDPPGDPENDPGEPDLWMQEDPIVCRFERRRGKVVTVLEGYTGADADFRELARQLKQHLGVGGTWKNDQILIQGDYRDRIMGFLKGKGFKVKRVGG